MKIQDIFLDYESGILKINGRTSRIPVRVIMKSSDGWNSSKIFNSEAQGQYEVIPELVLDVTQVEEFIDQKRLTGIVERSIKTALDALNSKPG